jgi:hypothetical protein
MKLAALSRGRISLGDVYQNREQVAATAEARPQAAARA